MGATTFVSYGVGKTADRAFSDAREQAAYEHSHAGYTGTVAEKYDVIVVHRQPRVRLTSDQLTALLLEARGTVVEYESEGKAEKRTERARKRLEEALVLPSAATLDRIIAAYDDKWGPCIGIKLGGAERQKVQSWLHTTVKRGEKVFVFMGWASC